MDVNTQNFVFIGKGFFHKNNKYYKSTTEKIAKGGYGTVYFGEMQKYTQDNQYIGRSKIAIKQVSTQINFNNQQQLNQFKNSWIYREVEIWQKINQQKVKNALQLIDKFYLNKRIYFIMPVCQYNLKELIQAKYRPEKSLFIPLKSVITILKDLANVIKELHQFNPKKPIAHRDIKPENILLKQQQPGPDKGNILILDQNGNKTYYRLYLSDFGFAKIIDRCQNIKHTLLGTTRYMAPQMLNLNQQINQAKMIIIEYDISIDIWAFAIVCARLLGKTMYGKDGQKIKTLREAQIKMTDKQIDEIIQQKLIKKRFKQADQNDKLTQYDKKFFETILRKCLKIDPQQRWKINELCKYIETHYKSKYQSAKQKIQKANQSIKQSKKPAIDILELEYQICKKCFDFLTILNLIRSNIIHIKILIYLIIKDYISSCYEIKFFYDIELNNEQKAKIQNQFQEIYNKSQTDSNNSKIFETLENDIFKYTNQDIDATKLIPKMTEINSLFKEEQIQQLMRYYLQIYENQIIICPLSNVIITLFKIIANKKKILKKMEQKNSYQKTKGECWKILESYQRQKQQLQKLDNQIRSINRLQVKNYLILESKSLKDKQNKYNQYLQKRQKFKYDSLYKVKVLIQEQVQEQN